MWCEEFSEEPKFLAYVQHIFLGEKFSKEGFPQSRRHGWLWWA